MDDARRIIRINAQEIKRLPASHTFLPPGIPRPSDSDLMSNGSGLFPEAIIEGLYPEYSALPHQLLFVCWESHHLALERYKYRWEYTLLNSEWYGYNYRPQPSETWEPPKDRHVQLFEIRRHFLAEEKASQGMEITLMDLKNDIVYLVPEMYGLSEWAMLAIMVRWFPFLSNIQYLCVTFESISKALAYEQINQSKPRYLTKFKGLKNLIVTVKDWMPQGMGIHPDFRDAYFKNKGRIKLPKTIMEVHFERLEKEVPGWKRPKLKIILDDNELQGI
jgi:hypothetical protein